MNKIIKIMCLISIALAFSYDLYIKLTNIDMTNTRLFITYWWQYLITVIVYVVAYSIYNYIDKKEIRSILKDITPKYNKDK